jgi:shikimate kinase
MKTWVLIGMMGAGKTTVGRQLAILSGREFVDTDTMIQNRLGKSISKIFEFYGEETFRDHESSIVKSLSAGPFVVSTGGGVVLRQENIDYLKSIGTLIYLHASAETLKERLKVSKRKRPLLSTENWEETLENLITSRQKQYRQADIIIELDHYTIEQATESLFEALKVTK